MGINVKTGVVTASYANVWKPKPNKQGKLKYSICLLIDKSKKDDVKAYEEAIKAAFDEGVAKGMFTSNQWPIVKKPLRDGDEEIKLGLKKAGIGYENKFFLNANAEGDPNAEHYYGPPEITKPVDGKVVAITDQSEFYSGCECRAAISFFPFNTEGSRGIAVGLNALFKVSDGERLDGRESAQSAFSEFAEEVGTLDSDKAAVTGTTSEPFSG